MIHPDLTGTSSVLLKCRTEFIAVFTSSSRLALWQLFFKEGASFSRPLELDDGFSVLEGVTGRVVLIHAVSGSFTWKVMK